MMKAAKLGWAGPGAGQEQGRSRAGAELRLVKQSREERGQELGRNWGGARNVQDRSLQGAGREYSLFHILFSPKLAPKPNLIKIG